MDKDTEARIQQLEETLAHMTRVTDDLHEVIARQDADIALLTRRVEMLMRFAAEQQAHAEGSIPLADQRPPHW
ncbi:SlyX family protein [Paracoccus benzoatiresistens]|uniref:SlyX family protein n=1 Tax=Paracoccus benzoatiresistens TaxID=2997341 RepID=A0ABT4J7T7_9RHOB|nr:SlyX family protein [Paracoccus sp. EF6]MCZ0962720.1 SlyX family protein [Paracoccus sp. EF6]